MMDIEPMSLYQDPSEPYVLVDNFGVVRVLTCGRAAECRQLSRRVALSFNACEGLGTTDLEAINLAGGMAAVRGVVRSVNDRNRALIEALEAAERLCNEALPRFNWAGSALDANAFDLLNTVPAQIRRALEGAKGACRKADEALCEVVQ